MTIITDSPSSPYIFLPNVHEGKDFMLKTQPFYSMFYHTENIPDTNDHFTKQVRAKAEKYHGIDRDRTSGRSCHTIFRRNANNDPQYVIYEKLPFSLSSSSGIGASNLSFLMLVFVATIVLGTITISYWTYLLGNNPMEDRFKQAIGTRSFYLSMVFVVMFVVLSLMFYEFFSLKFLSLKWFRAYEDNEPTNFYDFLLNTRKIVLWILLMIGLGMVMFTTITLSHRPEQFQQQIVMNIIAIFVLFVAQYLYYQNITSKYIKTFSLVLSVFVIGFVIFLLYAT
jgi:hypothetical protein